MWLGYPRGSGARRRRGRCARQRERGAGRGAAGQGGSAGAAAPAPGSAAGSRGLPGASPRDGAAAAWRLREDEPGVMRTMHMSILGDVPCVGCALCVNKAIHGVQL